MSPAGAWPEPGRPTEAGAFLSGDEIRELLRADAHGAGPAGTPGPAASADGGAAHAPARVLIVSRRAADVDLFRACLQSAGAIPTVARNPFTALDRVRLDEPDLVVSDLDLWAHDGALLCQRLRRQSREPLVLFVADRARSAGLEERTRRAGAAGLLLRPLRPGEVEDRLAALLLRARDGQSEGRKRREEPEDAAAAGTSAAAADGRGEVVPAELAWLRFFHGASRVARLDATRAERARALVRRALEDLHPRAVAIVYREGERGAAVVEAEEGLHLDRIRDLLGPAPDDRSSLQVRCGETDSEVGLILAGLPSSIVAEGSLYLDDVRLLLAAALSS